MAFWCQSYQRQQAQFILKVEWRSSSRFAAEATSCSPACFFPYSFRAEHLVWAQDMSIQRLSASWWLASYDHVVQYMGCRGSETDNWRLPSVPWKERGAIHFSCPAPPGMQINAGRARQPAKTRAECPVMRKDWRSCVTPRWEFSCGRKIKFHHTEATVIVIFL